MGRVAAMADEMNRDLPASQKSEFKALVDFQNWRAAKLAKIEATEKQKELTETALADLLDRAAKAFEDLEATMEAKAADEKFVSEMDKQCEIVDQEYQACAKVRKEVNAALSETIEIFTGEDGWDCFARSVGISFLQTDMTLEAQGRKTNKVMATLMTAAQKNHDVESLGSCSAREAWCLHQGQGGHGQDVGGAQDPLPPD